MKFRILRGMHSDNDPIDKSRRIYLGKNGDIIETDTNLVQRFNVDGFPPKFVQVSESEERKHSDRRAGRGKQLGKVETADAQHNAVATIEPPKVDIEDLRTTLQALHHKKLNKYAEDNEYDIEGLTSNEEKINAIILQADLR